MKKNNLTILEFLCKTEQSNLKKEMENLIYSDKKIVDLDELNIVDNYNILKSKNIHNLFEEKIKKDYLDVIIKDDADKLYGDYYKIYNFLFKNEILDNDDFNNLDVRVRLQVCKFFMSECCENGDKFIEDNKEFFNLLLNKIGMTNDTDEFLM